MKNRSWLIYLTQFLALSLLSLAWLLGVGILSAESGKHLNAEWPQWRGPARDGISNETALLTSWPADGPEVLWRIPLGDGYSGVSISQGRAYTMSALGDDEFVICLEASNGKEIWRFRTDSRYVEGNGDGPRSTPTVGGDSVFVLSAKGRLYALHAKSGEKLWEHNFVKEFGSSIPTWGFTTSALVENDFLLVEVGGEAGKSIVAFHKETGDVVWTSHTDAPAYSSPIAITVDGIRQVIFLTSKTLLSISPTDGKSYWTYPWLTHNGINVATPIFIPEDKIFISASYDKGAALVRMKAAQDAVEVEEVWKNRVMKNHFNSSVLWGNYLYGFDNTILRCIEANTGAKQWATRGFGKGSLLLVDGHLIVLGDGGKLALVEATPSGYKEKANAQILQGKCWTVPTLAGGKLYLRNQKEVVCLDLSSL